MARLSNFCTVLPTNFHSKVDEIFDDLMGFKKYFFHKSYFAFFLAILGYSYLNFCTHGTEGKYLAIPPFCWKDLSAAQWSKVFRKILRPRHIESRTDCLTFDDRIFPPRRCLNCDRSMTKRRSCFRAWFWFWRDKNKFWCFKTHSDLRQKLWIA